jgi:hypothetical protein
MTRNFFILFLSVLNSAFFACGQEIDNITWFQREEKIVVTYDITGAKYFERFDITLYVSTDGGRTFTGPLKEVTGDVGANIGEGKNKTVTWNVLDEYPGFGGKIIFDLRAGINPQKVKHKFFIGYKGTYSSPVGIMTGLTGKVGFYLASHLNYDYFTEPLYETDGQLVAGFNEQGYYSFIEGDKIRRLSVTGGLLIQMNWKWHWYIGTGFSEYQLLWQIARYDFDDNETGTSWVKHTGESFRSAGAETGLLFNFGHFFLAGGISSPGFKWVEGTVAAGFTF